MLDANVRAFTLVFVALIFCLCNSLNAADVVFSYTFDYPMSWSDDICMRGLSGIQSWDVVPGGNPGGALRISAAVWKQPGSYEIRTLQINHEH